MTTKLISKLLNKILVAINFVCCYIKNFFSHCMLLFMIASTTVCQISAGHEIKVTSISVAG